MHRRDRGIRPLQWYSFSPALTLDKEEDRDRRIVGIKKLRKCFREIERHNNSSPVQTLEKSLFVSLFAAFDKYTGDLLSIIYRVKPDLYKNINREIALSEALGYSSMEELRIAMLEKEIESIRRKSYVEQFSDIEKKFSIQLTVIPPKNHRLQK